MVNTLKALKRLGPFQAKQPDTVVYTYFIYQGMSLTPLARMYGAGQEHGRMGDTNESSRHFCNRQSNIYEALKRHYTLKTAKTGEMYRYQNGLSRGRFYSIFFLIGYNNLNGQQKIIGKEFLRCSFKKSTRYIGGLELLYYVLKKP